MPHSRANPIPPPDERLQVYRQGLRAGRGLTADQWSDFDRIEKQIDPDGFARRKEIGRRHVAISAAAAMDLGDLVAVLAYRTRSTALALPAVSAPTSIAALESQLPAPGDAPAVQILMEDERGRVTAYEPDEIRGLIAAQAERIAGAAREGRLAVVPRADA